MSQATIQNAKIETLVRRQVLHSLSEILVDPDFGLELKPSAIKRLKQSTISRSNGLVKSLRTILTKYQLK